MKRPPLGLGYLDIVGIVLIMLKLTRLINWSWWWVLCPFWIPIIICIGLFIYITIKTTIERIHRRVKP